MSEPNTAQPQSTVLIVDDDRSVATALRLAIETKLKGVRVLTAGHGGEGLDTLREHRVDLLVTDLRMPVMDGITFLSHVMEEFPQLPRAVMSSLGSGPRDHAAQTGVLAVLTKPVNVIELAEQVGEWLRDCRPHTYAERLNLSSFVQLVGFDRKSCTMGVKDADTGRLGELHFHEGRLVNAVAGDLRGTEAALFLLRWRNVHVWLRDHVPSAVDHIHMGVDHLLLQAARLSDEARVSGDKETGGVPTPQLLRETRPPEVGPIAPPEPIVPEPAPAVREYPESLDLLIDQAIDAFRAKDFALAKELWEEAQGRDPKHPVIKHNLRLVERHLAEQ